MKSIFKPSNLFKIVRCTKLNKLTSNQKKREIKSPNVHSLVAVFQIFREFSNITSCQKLPRFNSHSFISKSIISDLPYSPLNASISFNSPANETSLIIFCIPSHRYRNSAIFASPFHQLFSNKLLSIARRFASLLIVKNEAYSRGNQTMPRFKES